MPPGAAVRACDARPAQIRVRNAEVVLLAGGGAALAAQLALAVAFNGDDMIAAAFYLFDDTSLYGRYWGSVVDVDGLHFELCYYQGIKFCIRHGLQRFDPGVQGELKILRGFEPEITFSLHWLADARFQRAIAQFCEEEAEAVAAYQREARSLLPYREV